MRKLRLYSPKLSPFIYSEDENGEINVEHQPLIHNLLKAYEGTTYGTLHLLKDQDGTYYIHIVEEGVSVTVLDNMILYAVDYLDDGSVLTLMYDILGSPHTIREKVAPNSFVDQYGNSYLDAISSKDDSYVIVNRNNPEPSSYYVATFTKPDSITSAKLMISLMGNDIYDPQQLTIYRMFEDINGSQNWWIIDEIMSYDNYHRQIAENILNANVLQVEVFDGVKWVYQGTIIPNMNWIEEKLIILDLSNIQGNELIVKLSSPTRIPLTFNHIAIDFTEDLPMTIHELEMTSAVLNNESNVLEILGCIDENYVVLHNKDGVRLGFADVPLASGYSRGFGVSATGFVYVMDAIIDDELRSSMKGKTFEEIKQIILDSGREELIADLPIIEGYYYYIMSFGGLSTEEIILKLYDIYY